MTTGGEMLRLERLSRLHALFDRTQCLRNISHTKHKIMVYLRGATSRGFWYVEKATKCHDGTIHSNCNI